MRQDEEEEEEARESERERETIQSLGHGAHPVFALSVSCGLESLNDCLICGRACCFLCTRHRVPFGVVVCVRVRACFLLAFLCVGKAKGSPGRSGTKRERRGGGAPTTRRGPEIRMSMWNDVPDPRCVRLREMRFVFVMNHAIYERVARDETETREADAAHGCVPRRSASAVTHPAEG